MIEASNNKTNSTMERQSSIAFKLQDFSDFVKALTDKMVEAQSMVNENERHLIDLRLQTRSGCYEIYGYPITLNDYLEIWNNVAEVLKNMDETYIDFYVNNTEYNNAEFLDACLWISWDNTNGVYSFE